MLQENNQYLINTILPYLAIFVPLKDFELIITIFSAKEILTKSIFDANNKQPSNEELVRKRN